MRKSKTILLIGLFICMISVLIIINAINNQNSHLIRKNTQFIKNNGTPISKSENNSLFYEFIPSNRSYDNINCIISGDNLENLRYDSNNLKILRNWDGVSSGEIYIEFEFSILSINYYIMNCFIINGEIMGSIDTDGETNFTLQVFDYSTLDYHTIHLISSSSEFIRKENGIINTELNNLYSLSKICNDFINLGKIKFKFILRSNVIPANPTNFTQELNIFWLKLIVAKDIDVKQLEPVEFIDLTSGFFHLTGDLNLTNQLDGNYINFGTSNVAQFQTVICNFYLEYDLGLYKNEEILGIIFQHLDWIEYGASSYFLQNPNIYIYNFSDGSEILIQKIRLSPTKSIHTAIPDKWDNNISIINNGLMNGSRLRIHYYAEIMNLDPNPTHFSISIDLAALKIVRSVGPIIENITVIDDWVYCGEEARINGTIHAGKYPIDRVIISNPYGIICNDEGFFEYSIIQQQAGIVEFYIMVYDIQGYTTSSGPYYIQFNKRPIQINVNLKENPFPIPPKINMTITIRDAIDQLPVSNIYFDLFVEREGILISEYRSLYTNLEGKYSFLYDVDKNYYLDTEYTFIIEVQEGYNTQFGSTLAYITPVLAPCSILITDYNNSTEYWAGDLFDITVNFHSLVDISQAILLLNGTEISSLNIQEGINELTITNNRAGKCIYQISAVNVRGYYNISNPIELYFKPNPINVTVKPAIDNINRYIFLNISITDLRYEMALANIPINIVIYDNDQLFWDSMLQSTLPYTPIYIQFDLNSHNFTIYVIIDDTQLYAGNVIKSFNIPFIYNPYPVQSVIPMIILTGFGIGIFIFQLRRRNNHIYKEV
ncbi:MAG: hypothetical protein ACTSPY_02525 [Candidatus Helarchaeota archaeon]